MPQPHPTRNSSVSFSSMDVAIVPSPRKWDISTDTMARAYIHPMQQQITANTSRYTAKAHTVNPITW